MRLKIGKSGFDEGYGYKIVSESIKKIKERLQRSVEKEKRFFNIFGIGPAFLSDSKKSHGIQR